MLLSLENTVTSCGLGYQHSDRRLEFFFFLHDRVVFTVSGAQLSPVEIRTWRYLSDTKMAER